MSLDGEELENVRYCKAPVVSLAQGEVKPLMRQVYWPWDSRYLAKPMSAKPCSVVVAKNDLEVT